jgi:hypothetical protein
MIFDSFHNGGWGMWPTLVVGLMMIGVSARYAVSPERRFVPLIVASSVLTFLTGALGFVTGLIATSQYFDANAAPAAVVVVGFGESLNDVGLALVLLAVGMIAVTVGAARHARAPLATA